MLEVFCGAANRQGGDARQVAAVDHHVAGLAAQTGAVAIGARLGAQVLGQFLAHALGLGLPVAAFQVRQDALERMLAAHHVATIVEVAERYVVLAGAAEDQLAVWFLQLFKRLVEIDAVVLRQ